MTRPRVLAGDVLGLSRLLAKACGWLIYVLNKCLPESNGISRVPSHPSIVLLNICLFHCHLCILKQQDHQMWRKWSPGELFIGRFLASYHSSVHFTLRPLRLITCFSQVTRCTQPHLWTSSGAEGSWILEKWQGYQMWRNWSPELLLDEFWHPIVLLSTSLYSPGDSSVFAHKSQDACNPILRCQQELITGKNHREDISR